MPVSDDDLIREMQDIGGLLFRRLKGELSEREQIDLDQWMIRQDLSSRQFFEECTDYDSIYAALQVMYSFDQEAALADLQKKINFGPRPVVPVVPVVRTRRMGYRFLVAASVLGVIICGAVIFFLTRQKSDVAALPIVQRYKNDVAPGGDKALLKLDDGTTIILDSASNGQLAKQGNTQVLKLENGRLAYHSGKPNGEEVHYNTISTPRGGQYQVALPDGSMAWLNAESSLKFPTSFSGHERAVQLTGEAYFEVTKNASMPFKVALANNESAQIEVLGTSFDVMAYQDEDNQKTTLVSGEVKVIAGINQVVLKPGQQARVNKSGSGLNLISDVNMDETLAWKNGLFQFQDASIESIMRQAARWYDVEVEYRGKIDQQFIGKIPRRVNISTLLKILESTGWVHFVIDGKKIIVSP